MCSLKFFNLYVEWVNKCKILRACLGKHFSSLNFRHSISITHHSFFHTHLATSLLFSSLNFFTLFMGPTPVSQYSFFFFLVLNSPKLIYIKKKKKKKKKNSQPRKRKRKRKKKEQRQPRKKKNFGQKLRLWVPHVCLFTEMPLNYELWKLKTAFCCFQFP